MSLIDVIDALSTGTYTVTRRSAGTYVEGRYVLGSTSSFNIVASIQPLLRTGGRHLRTESQGQHGEEMRVIYTKTDLLTRTSTRDPDVVTIDSEPWEVFEVQRWQAFGDAHWRVIASRKVVP